MFDSMMTDLMNGVGAEIELFGSKFILLDKKSWLNEAGQVTANIVIPSSAAIGEAISVQCILTFREKKNDRP